MPLSPRSIRLQAIFDARYAEESRQRQERHLADSMAEARHSVEATPEQLMVEECCLLFGRHGRRQTQAESDRIHYGNNE